MKSTKFLISLSFLAFASTASASVITCGSLQRTATLDSATTCVTGLGNPQLSDINANFTSTTGWTKEGELTGNGSNDNLTANLTSGTWGSSNIAGTWSISAAFWTMYDQAVLSMHVGNGGGDPDYFAWLVESGETSGTWSYERLSGGGGGLSNLKLWGADDDTPSTSVPAPAIIALFGLGLIGMSAARKSVK